MCTLRNAISHTGSNMLYSTDTMNGVFPNIARTDNQASRKNKGEGKREDEKKGEGQIPPTAAPPTTVH